MTTEALRNILLAASVEESDPDGRLFPAEERDEAARASGAPLPPQPGRAAEDAFLAARAAFLLEKAGSRFPTATWLDPTAPAHPARHPLAALLLLALAAALGYFSNELGPERRINILAFPLLGILAWSLLVYLREIWILARPVDALPAWFQPERLFREKREPAPTRSAGSDDETATLLATARTLFLRRWAKLSAPSATARIKSLLHTAALVLAASAVAGMYVRGLANEYRAVWESTFIEDSATLRSLLGFVLGPAAALLGSELPSAAELDAIRGHDAAGEGAARWIHWYALTIALFVVAPRAALAAVWRLRASRNERRLPYRETAPRHFARLLATSTGTTRRVLLVPYAFEPDPARRAALASRLEDELGAAVSADWHPALAFGDEEDFALDEPVEEGTEILPVLSFSATPEAETHLAFCRTLAARFPDAIRRVLLDAEAFDERSRELGAVAERRTEREGAWRRLFAGEPAELVFHPELPA
jgi:hypothetical protein